MLTSGYRSWRKQHSSEERMCRPASPRVDFVRAILKQPSHSKRYDGLRGQQALLRCHGRPHNRNIACSSFCAVLEPLVIMRANSEASCPHPSRKSSNWMLAKEHAPATSESMSLSMLLRREGRVSVVCVEPSIVVCRFEGYASAVSIYSYSLNSSKQ